MGAARDTKWVGEVWVSVGDVVVLPFGGPGFGATPIAREGATEHVLTKRCVGRRRGRVRTVVESRCCVHGEMNERTQGGRNFIFVAQKRSIRTKMYGKELMKGVEKNL